MTRGRTLVALAAAAVLVATPDAAHAQGGLKSCGPVQCGRVAVPLDRSGGVPGRVSLYVERQRALRRPARGVTLLLAGGPGQPATFAYDDGSRNPYGEFRRLAPTNDVVAFDGRGTGRSGLLRCPELERANLIDAGSAAADCARRLGPKRGFYRTSDSVDDIEAVRAALGADKLTLIGVSYGTFLAQAYAARYPTRVERVLLDSVLDVSGWDPFYRDVFAAVPRVLDASCGRICQSFTDDAVDDLGRLVARLRRGALHGAVTLPNGHRRKTGLTRQELFFALVSGDLDPVLRTSFPAAVKAALGGDLDPILRLKRRAAVSEGAGSPREFSSALYAATACEELPFPWPRFSDPAARFGPIDAAIAQIPEQDLYPFDRATDAGNDFIRMCRRWPEASPAPYAAPPRPLPDVPVLMLAGQMDLRTPVETARSAAADWPHAQVLTVPGTGHSTLSADFGGCSTKAARRFLRGQTVAARCRRGPSLFSFTLPPPPRSLAEVPALFRGLRGERGRALTAAVMTLGDVSIEVFAAAISGQGLNLRAGGLRGGYWSIDLKAREPVLRMHRVEYVPGVRVSGGLSYGDDPDAIAVLHVSGPRTPDGVIRFGEKRISGRLGGKRFRINSRELDATELEASAASAAAGVLARPLVGRAELRLARRAAQRPRPY